MKKLKCIGIAGAVTTMLSGFWSGTALAQSAAPAADKVELEEIVVTAEKREMNLQKISTSIQVKTGEDLRAEGKKRIDEIMQGTAGIQAQSNATGLTFFVRGVDSSTGQPGQSIVSPVAVLIDGVAQSRDETVRGATVDLARAEIMRGPQSTTLGANALSGAVSLVSNQPALGVFDANGSLEVGDYAKRAVEGVFNAPLSSDTALRLAFSTDQRNGYISSGLGDSDLYTARVKFRWKPSDALDTVFTASQQHIGGYGTSQNILLAYGYWTPISSSNASSLSLTNSSCASSDSSIIIRGCPGSYYAVAPSNPGSVTPSFRDRSDPWDDGFPRYGFSNNPVQNSTINQFSEQVDWDTAIGTVTVLPAFQLTHYFVIETPMGASYMNRWQSEATPTLDVHLNSKSGSALTWTAGLYYSHDKIYDQRIAFVEYPDGGMGDACDPSADSQQSCYTYEDTPLTLRVNKSVYANGQYSLTDRLRLIGGVRYAKDTAEMQIRDDVDGTAAGPDATALAAATVYSGKGSWSKATYRGGVEYDVMPGTMVYAVYSTGYTPGSFSVTNSAMGAVGGTVNQNPATTLKQISAGFKSQWFDNRVQLNVDLFRSTFYNRAIQGVISAYTGDANSNNCTYSGPPTTLQYSSTGTGGYCLVVGQDAATVPQFVSQGVDLDGAWLISADDKLSVTYEYLKAKYDSAPTFNGDYSATAIQALDSTISLTDATTLSNALAASINGFIGAVPQNSPVNSATLDYQHVFRLSSGSQITPRVSATYKSKYWSFGGSPGANVSQILADTSSSDLAWQQAYTRWDLYLAWDSADGKLGASAYVKNAGNEVVMTNYTYPYVSLEAPRTFGVILSARL
ncbi:MAG: TonB-dependent receptor [Steroidobacteraceae bacterium]